MNIPEIREKIKRPEFYEPVALISIFILISLASFCLGRISVIGVGTGDGGVTIYLPDGNLAKDSDLLSYKKASGKLNTNTNTVSIESGVFASKNGSTYYFPSCGSGSRIKEENKVWFTDAGAAETAGYRLAKVCE